MQNKEKSEKLPMQHPKPANLHTVPVVVADDKIASSKVLYIQAIDLSVVHVFIL